MVILFFPSPFGDAIANFTRFYFVEMKAAKRLKVDHNPEDGTDLKFEVRRFVCLVVFWFGLSSDIFLVPAS
jgi:hypothetical protein